MTSQYLTHYLIGGFNPPEKYEFVRLDHHLNYGGKVGIHVPNHQPVMHILYIYIYIAYYIIYIYIILYIILYIYIIYIHSIYYIYILHTDLNQSVQASVEALDMEVNRIFRGPNRGSGVLIQ